MSSQGASPIPPPHPTPPPVASTQGTSEERSQRREAMPPLTRVLQRDTVADDAAATAAAATLSRSSTARALSARAPMISCPRVPRARTPTQHLQSRPESLAAITANQVLSHPPSRSMEAFSHAIVTPKTPGSPRHTPNKRTAPCVQDIPAGVSYSPREETTAGGYGRCFTDTTIDPSASAPPFPLHAKRDPRAESANHTKRGLDGLISLND